MMKARFWNVLPACFSSVARHRTNGDTIGLPTGCPYASHPSNRTSDRHSATPSRPATSDFARPFGAEYTARRFTRRPDRGSSR